VQVAPIKPVLKALRSKRLIPNYDHLVSNCAFNFNLRRYSKVDNIVITNDKGRMSKEEVERLAGGLLRITTRRPDEGFRGCW